MPRNRLERVFARAVKSFVLKAKVTEQKNLSDLKLGVPDRFFCSVTLFDARFYRLVTDQSLESIV